MKRGFYKVTKEVAQHRTPDYLYLSTENSVEPHEPKQLLPFPNDLPLDKPGKTKGA